MFQKRLYLFFAGIAFALLEDVALTLTHERSAFLEAVVGVVVLWTYVIVVGGLMVVIFECGVSMVRQAGLEEGLRRIFQTRIRAFAMGFALVFAIANSILEHHGKHFLRLPR